MFFTQDDYKKIQQWLTKNSVKDTEFNEATIPFNGNEIVSIVQGNQNKKVFLKDLIAQVFNLGISDFVNITDKYDAPNINLEEAIRLIPSRARKEGQVITFLNKEDGWNIYQFKGALNQWNVLDTWEDLFDWEKLIINSILPDEEDLTKSLPDVNGNSYLSLKDREYNPEDFSGLGRIILRKNIVEVEDPIYGKVKKNILYQDMFTQSNTIYKIRYDFDLNDSDIAIPEGCVLDFQGGSFNNGTIVGVQFVSAPLKKIFNNISFAKSHIDKWNAEWFGDVINDFPSTYQNIEHSLPEYSSVYVNSNITFGDTVNILKRINLFFLDITFTSNNKDVFVYGNKSNGITNVTFKANNIKYNLKESDNVYAQTNSFLKLKSCSFCNFDFYTCSNIGIPIYFYPEGSCGQNIFRFNKIFNGNKGVYFSNGISTDWDTAYWCEGNQFFFGFIVRYNIGVELENFIKAKANLYVGAIDCVEVDGLDILDNSNKERYFTKSVWLLNFYRLGDSIIDKYDTFLDPSYGIFTAGSVYAKAEIHSERAIRTNELLNIRATSNGRIDFNDYSGTAEDYLARIMLTSEGDLTIQGNRGLPHKIMKYWMKSPLNGNKTITANSNSITITHPSPLPNANYGISVSPYWNTSWWIQVKNQNGFVVGFNTPPSQESSIDYTIYGV